MADAPQPNTSDFGRRVGQTATAPPPPTAPPQAERPEPDAPPQAAPSTASYSQPAPSYNAASPVPSAASIAGTTGLNPNFSAALTALINASQGRLYIQSGYRSDATQATLFANAVKKYGSEQAARKWVAPPGHSNHNKGLAADLGGDLEWAHQHAAEFGLVFPMSWENWHIEPVGVRDGASPQAYTDGPPGTLNPTTDPTLATSPEHMVATLTAAMTSIPGTDTASQMEQFARTGSLTAAGAPQPNTGDTGQRVGQGGGGTTHGNVTPEQVYGALVANGLDPTAAAALTSIAGRESSFNTGAYNGNRATGDDSHGLFQINLLNGGWGPFLQSHGIDPASLNTLEGSAKAAAAIYQSSGLHPWGGYKGVPWYHGVDMNVGVQASGGKVTTQQLQGIS